MVSRRALVIVAGEIAEIPVGDTLAGTSGNLPTGGSAGMYLRKASAADYDAIFALLDAADLTGSIALARIPNDLITFAKIQNMSGPNKLLGRTTGGAGDIEEVDVGTWSTWTPTVTAGSGSFTTVSATGRWTVIGKTVHFWARITITTNGTAATYVQFTLPVSARNVDTSAYQHFIGRQSAVGGNIIVGQINDAANTCILLTYNNGYPGASGEKLTVSGTYEIA